MRTPRCQGVMSSGITQPFGWLSRSPGYVSDSLLSRSPLCIATPCDLHVLATPPAFRLSQDQTLQLNFSDRSDPRAPRGPRGLGRTDSFTDRVILETSLSNPPELDPLPWLLLPRRRLGRAGSVGPSYGPARSARLKHLLLASLNLDQGRSLCVRHEGA